MDATEMSFRLMDVIYIVVGVGTGLGFYWKMVMNDKEHDTAMNNLKDAVDKNEVTMFKKFTGIHTRMEKNEEANKLEVVNIHKELGELKIVMSKMDGKLDILISK